MAKISVIHNNSDEPFIGAGAILEKRRRSAHGRPFPDQNPPLTQVVNTDHGRISTPNQCQGRETGVQSYVRKELGKDEKKLLPPYFSLMPL